MFRGKTKIKTKIKTLGTPSPNPCKGLRPLTLLFVIAIVLFVSFRPGVTVNAGWSDTWDNARLTLSLDRELTAIKITDKANGYEWASVPLNARYERMSSNWQQFAESLAVIDYISESGAQSRALMNGSGAQEPVYELFNDGFAVTLHYPDAEIKIKMDFRLTEEGLTVYIPDDGIQQLGANLIARIMVMPFLGASYADERSGYFFLPDGCGALMRFTPAREYGSAYVSRIYGEDYAISGGYTQSAKSLLEVSLQSAYLPVYGVAHGDSNTNVIGHSSADAHETGDGVTPPVRNSFVAIVEAGDAYCQIEANPAGNVIDYFWIAPRFIYHELYWQPTGRGVGFNTPTSTRNVVNARVSYHFLSGSGADYTGMAVRYRDTLVEQGILQEGKVNAAVDIPLKLDAIMAEQQKSLIGSSTLAMTKTTDVERWMQSLSSKGMRNLVVSLLGAEKGGISGHTVGTFAIDGKIGGAKGLERLYQTVLAVGARLTLQTNYLSGYEHQISAGRSVYGVNGAFVNETIRKPLYSVKRFLNLQELQLIAQKIANQKDYIRGLSLDGTANTLLSDHRSRRVTFRDQAMVEVQKTLETFAGNTHTLMLESPNAYAFAYADAVYNTPDNNSRQSYEDEAVPFYQTVLSGYVDMFTPYLNYRSNTDSDLLRLIDYNMYPAYVLTERYSNEFTKTNIVDVYSSRFDDWEPLILRHYQQINDVLKHVRGQKVISRDEVVPGVFATRYSGGGYVVVNYSDAPYTFEGTSVNALSGLYIAGKGA